MLYSIPDQESFAIFIRDIRDGKGSEPLGDDDVCAIIMKIGDPEGDFALLSDPFTERLDALLEE